jgi:hypothetical protein
MEKEKMVGKEKGRIWIYMLNNQENGKSATQCENRRRELFRTGGTETFSQ